MSKTAMSSPSLNGNELLNGNKLDNGDRLDDLFRRHNGWLKRWLDTQRWTVKSSEDIASDVFLALVAMPDISAVRKPRAMMKTIARRLIYDARRREDLFRDYQQRLALFPESFEISPEEKFLLIEALLQINEVLSTLSPKARRAFLLSRVDGVRQADIGKELNISTRTVRKYVAQGYEAIYDAQMAEED